MAQKGFTLLELLVVITLLAVLSVGALVAYEGIGENAQAVGAANNIKTADSAIRTFAALENVYPNQWDNLVNSDDGSVNDLIAEETRALITSLDLTAAAGVSAELVTDIYNSLINTGLTEFQSLLSTSVVPAGVNPNEAWNESAPGVTNPADEMELELTDLGVIVPQEADYDNLSVVVSGGDGGTCTVGGQSITTSKATGAVAEINSTILNRINDVLDDDGCHLVVAVGFGKDVPGTTLDSRASISTAPTYVSDRINPSENYARYIALFHVGSDVEDGAGDPTGVVSDIRNRARLIAVVDTEGRGIDESIAGAFAE